MNARRIGFVVSKKRLRVSLKGELIIPKHVVLRAHQPIALQSD